MTNSLMIRNGDLSLGGPGGFALVSDTQKLLQDLRHALLEPRGSDPFHPEWGSTLDGGVLPDGGIAEPMIGGIIDAEALTNIEAEIRRVVNSYQQSQMDRLSQETLLYAGKNTFGLGELISSIDSVDVTQVADTVVVRVTVSTANGDSLTIAQPLST